MGSAPSKSVVALDEVEKKRIIDTIHHIETHVQVLSTHIEEGHNMSASLGLNCCLSNIMLIIMDLDKTLNSSEKEIVYANALQMSVVVDRAMVRKFSL